MNTKRAGDVEIITEYTPEEWHNLRAQDITSTDAAALFGISPYLTPFELWHRKKQAAVVEFEPSERMKWGTRLQAAIAKGIGDDNEWLVREMPEYIRHVKLAMGSSFDFQIHGFHQYGFDEEERKRRTAEFKPAILEIKNVDSLAFKDGWLVDGDDVEAPAHIELQVQHQLAVSGLKLAYIGALIGGNRVVLIKRERDESVIDSLKLRIAAFWDSIDRNIEPKPDFERDAAFIAKLYRYAEPNKVITATMAMESLALKYKAFKNAAKISENEADAAKAELLTLIGNAEKVQGDGFTISAGVIGPTHVEYERKGYRDFRVFTKKAKEAVA